MNDSMGSRPVFSLIVSMSVPIMVSMLIVSLYNIVDSFWVAKLGTQALTAVSLAFPLQNVIVAAGVGMGIGVSSWISMCLGRKDFKGADCVASVGLILVFVHCILFVLAGLFIARPFLALFAGDGVVLEWSVEYSQIVLCLSFGCLFQMCFEKIFQSAGKMMVTMFLMASGCVINIILDPIFIFTFGLGVRGAAYATVIGQIAALIFYLLAYVRMDLGVRIGFRGLVWDWNWVKKIYSVAIPSSLMIALPSVLIGVLNGILAGFDALYVAILGLYFKLQTFVNMPVNGIIQGIRPIVGYNYGAGKLGRVRQTILYTLILAGVISLAGSFVSIVFPGPILNLFDAEPVLLEQGIFALRIVGIGFVLSTVAVVVCGVLEALGKGHVSLMISLSRQLIVLVPFALVASYFMGVAGVWLAFPVAEFVGLIFGCVSLYFLFSRVLKG